MPADWPVNRDFANRKDLIPQVEVLKRFRGIIHKIEALVPPSVTNLIDPFSTNYCHKLIRRIQMVMAAAQIIKSGDSASIYVNDAKRLWFLSAMPETTAAQRAGELRELLFKM